MSRRYAAHCERCGHNWRTKGKTIGNPPVSCPRCKARTDWPNPRAKRATRITLQPIPG